MLDISTVLSAGDRAEHVMQKIGRKSVHVKTYSFSVRWWCNAVFVEETVLLKDSVLNEM